MPVLVRLPSGCAHPAATAREAPLPCCFLSSGLKDVLRGPAQPEHAVVMERRQVMLELNFTLPVLSTAITSFPIATSCFPTMW